MKIKPTVPPVALAIELLAFLIEHDYPVSPSTSHLLIALATVACLVSLASSVVLFRQEVITSVFCILVAMATAFPTLFALATQGSIQ